MMMQAALVGAYGPPDVVRIAQVPRPGAGKGQVLVRVRAAAVTSADARLRAARFPPGFGVPARLMFGLRRPRRAILGSTFSGEVAATGPRVSELSPGDQVCGMTGLALGAHAEYVAVPADRVVRKPPEVTHDDAAGVLFGGTTAWYYLRDQASLRPGASVLVNGASGAIGTNAVQLANHLGARVTGVTSGANAALVTELGAERVIDHTVTDVTSIGERFDVVLDTVGNLSIASGRRLLNDGGVLLLAVASLGETIRARGDVKAGPSPERTEDFAQLLDLVAQRRLTVVVDGVHDLAGIADAHRRVDSGRKVGNLIVRP